MQAKKISVVPCVSIIQINLDVRQGMPTRDINRGIDRNEECKLNFRYLSVLINIKASF